MYSPEAIGTLYDRIAATQFRDFNVKVHCLTGSVYSRIVESENRIQKQESAIAASFCFLRGGKNAGLLLRSIIAAQPREKFPPSRR